MAALGAAQLLSALIVLGVGRAMVLRRDITRPRP